MVSKLNGGIDFLQSTVEENKTMGEKALGEKSKGRTVHMLLPASPTTSTFWDLTFSLASEVEWLRGETHYLRVRDNKTVRLSSCIVKFDPSPSESLQ